MPRAVSCPTLFAFSLQARSLYFCGPKPGDHDPDLPISQHYHARARTLDSDARFAAQTLPATPTRPIPHAQPDTTATAATIRTLIISTIHVPSSLPVHYAMPSVNKLETSRKAIEQLEAATHDEATNYNTAIIIIQDIARLEFVLRKAALEGKSWEETERIRRDIENMKSLFDRIERRLGI